MSTIAQSRDLSDPRTISDFAALMQDLDSMKALLVLTVCDIKAVGPGVWNGWKGQLLRTLYYEVEPFLTGGFTSTPRRERILEVKSTLAAALNEWSEPERQRVIDLHYDNYLLTVPHENQLRHMDFIRDTDRVGHTFATSVTTKAFEAITEITIIAPDHPNLLSVIAGSCAAAGANIVDAQIFTMRDGRALDSIFISRAFENGKDEHRRAERVAQLIGQALAGEANLPMLLLERTKKAKKVQAFKVPPRVVFNNSLSDKFTVLQVHGRDRPGFLSDVASVLADLSLDIASAHIATFGEKVTDSFYVTDLLGYKIEQPEKMENIRASLMKALGGSRKSKAKRISA